MVKRLNRFLRRHLWLRRITAALVVIPMTVFVFLICTPTMIRNAWAEVIEGVWGDQWEHFWYDETESAIIEMRPDFTASEINELMGRPRDWRPDQDAQEHVEGRP